MNGIPTKKTIILFLIIIFAFAILFGVCSLIAGYPTKKMVKKIYKERIEDIEN